MPENIRRIVVTKLEIHRKAIEFLGKQIDTEEYNIFLEIKALPLRHIFRIIAKNRTKLGIEKSVLTNSISQAVARVKLLITNL